MEENIFKVSSYDYRLPEELIAQNPADPRDSSRLMVLSREDGSLDHRVFSDLVEYLRPDDVLVRNDTKVMAARLKGKKVEGEAEVEILVLSRLSGQTWEAMVRPGRRLKPGISVQLSDGTIVKVDGIRPEGLRSVTFPDDVDVPSLLDKVGTVPLPPYITDSNASPEAYQTVFANKVGSAAAPTAGLHFTPELIERIEKKGVEILDVTLQVGLGTFRPVKEEDLRHHPMHRERCQISSYTADRINEAKAQGRRIVAVGTTSVRTLESMGDSGVLLSGERDTSLFIYPGFEFKIVDAMITNFHLPQSTLLMLVSAFAGRERTLNAYKEAVSMAYRFFSFGDAMFIY
ncbi:MULTISPECIES: tRNA preQ1(34) S-adenosylmethionine ribosyltransferase-isomerase QueA [Dethiosulfovibrio]|uniref:S-adenosylmethionine:tRNA ribosyltransferase-isomerase n=2 Tax=Dethiosulfovibrio TaxID=47054 RepID=A0ABS9ELP6_9BACT|nr:MULTISPECIES: tRNA preQ1(34) S-adenosylmethionine ribosyltransferase-isomerase QueA [Dethiosulfovibrio]MCF4113648.1 tRNA preQ1(34) S-adenosylmethionine ribosyltransferase-isomerase QueA [Dethiosulfovibrio russensis]MCF4142118.1 tRNA preQ1(34) S-adenosylmethionine ribosyltransferase-isomerase QueA [Dethiosulfovibrio marinus]MCF4144273.1 tRNA preQ1(34) S-adenosylmethionine ribosyltransferase-isomerase QueA [Dethiosulfovibrio acidaminovorans]